MKIARYFRIAIRGLWYYTWGHIFSLFMYDKKYLTGRWFAGRLNGLCALGWEWVTQDAVGRLFIGGNRSARFPVRQSCCVVHPENLVFHPDDLNNFHGSGQYFQAIGKIEIGKGSYIGPNVGLITSNHDPEDLNRHLPPKPIQLGEHCWVGMNSVILPGVILGKRTVVGAGSIVTKSFPEGNCVIAGNPAKIIKRLNAAEEQS